jgi:PAS domain S-box-containing protein
MPQGYLLGNVRLKSLGRLLQRYATSNGIEVAIVDERGSLVAHNISEMTMQRVSFGNHPTVVLALEGQESTVEFDQGQKYLLESAAIVPTPGWVAWVGLDMNDVLAPIHNMRNLLIGIMAAAALLGSTIAFMNARRLMRPLISLGQKAGQIADGRYEFFFRPSGFSEIDALANQIKNMTHAIKVREDSIVANEQRFRNLVNSIDGIVWEMEYATFRFLFVSRQAETILGYPVQDWHEDPSFWEHKTHPGDVRQAKSYCQLMSEKLEDHDFEYRMFAADGRTVWIHNLVTVVVENNRPVRLLGVMIDVTEQKELLEELSRSEENYREIFNATSDAMFIHDAETGQVMDVNQSMLKMYNCTYEQALGGHFEAFSMGFPYSAAKVKEKLQEAREEGFCQFEWRSRKVSGEIFWTEVSLRSTMIGGKFRTLASVRDISERKEAADELREAKERLSLLIERMPLGCILWSPEFTVNLWNPAAETIFGFAAEDMLGAQPYDTIVPAMSRRLVEKVWAKLMAGDESAHIVNENLTKDGKTITCEWNNTPLFDASGATIGVISMVQDISARKAAEDELANHRIHLEKLVTERTKQLETAQQELVQKERLAVLGQLTTTVSHEIRNPLGTVANALFLLKSALSGTEHEKLARPLILAERNVERCDNIISELLDFSRKRTIKKEPLDIDLLLAEFINELSFPENLQLHCDFAAQATVPTDAERLRRVMVNVITNALQALDEVPVAVKKLDIQTRIVDGRCEIRVKDNGPGMSEEVLARIYEPMFSTKNFGVGLGVPIIKNILEGHGGGVDYQSVVGMGTTVLMWLPLAEGIARYEL